MSNFRIKLLGLAALATTCAGISYGQTIACTGTNTIFGGAPFQNPTLRAESETELVADATATGCTVVGGLGVGGSTTGSVYATLSLPVTSKAITGVPGVSSEATLQITGEPAIQGTVSGNQVAFTGVIFPAGPFTMTVSNIRVNATGGGSPQVTETLDIQYTSAGLSANYSIGGASFNVGFILSTLGPTNLALIAPLNIFTSNSYATCTGNPVPAGGLGPLTAANLSFTVNIKELVTGAFRTQAQEVGSFVPGGGSAIGTASSPDQIALTLGNVPSSATVYVPQAITVNGTTLSVANSTAVSSPAAFVGLGTGPELSFTPSNNVVTILYSVTAAINTAPSTFAVPVYVIFGANAAAAQGPVTVLTAYSPAAAVSGPAASVPTFAVSTATPVSASTITLCQTTLLFPFVTNQLGFDTGIVIANTSTDNLGFGGTSSAKPQAGSCTMSFYGNGAPTPSTGVTVAGGPVATGTTVAFQLSSLASGFQGYAIAACPFLYAHGYAFIEYNLTQANGVAEGYLAEVLAAGRAAGPGAEAVAF